MIKVSQKLHDLRVQSEQLAPKFTVRLFYDVDQKNYHMNPLANRRGHYTRVTANEFMQLVAENKVTTR